MTSTAAHSCRTPERDAPTHLAAETCVSPRRTSGPAPAARVLGIAAALAVALGAATVRAEETDDVSAPLPVEDQAPVDGTSDEVDVAAASVTSSTLAMSADEPDWDDDWDDWDEELDTVPQGYSDPFEPVNRVTLSFNNAIDRLLLDPVTRLYRFSLPDFTRQAIVRILNNVNSPQVLVNDALQLEWRDAGVITTRLIVNSTAGLGGIFDAGQGMGLEHHESDFGQTLTLAGVPAGTYFVLPMFGPANMRDTIGIGVDALLHPTFYLLPGTDLLLFGGSAGVVTRARHFEEIQALKESSVDVYSALRSGYYQNRQAEIWARRESRRPREAGADPGDDEAWIEEEL